MATTRMAVMLTGMGHQEKLERISLEKVSALTAIQLTADRASSRDRMEELRAPMDLRASTEVVRPVLQEMIPSRVATRISRMLPVAQARTASLKGILKPTVAPVTKLDREMV